MMMPPFDFAVVFGPYCACEGEVYLAGQDAGEMFMQGQSSIDPSLAGSPVAVDGGEAYIPGQGPGQRIGDCEC